MTQVSITGDNIISALKTIGFTESTDKKESGNRVSLEMKDHKVSVSRGTLDSDETSRVRTELKPIFKTHEDTVKKSSDSTLLKVRDWLAGSSSK
jgi:hypothetical protein